MLLRGAHQRLGNHDRRARPHAGVHRRAEPASSTERVDRASVERMIAQIAVGRGRRGPGDHRREDRRDLHLPRRRASTRRARPRRTRADAAPATSTSCSSATSRSWSHAWDRSRITLTGDVGHTARVLNLHIFHLLADRVEEHRPRLDAGVPARGLHGEAYRGHIFWDELFIFPFLTLRVPELTRALLRYRARRLRPRPRGGGRGRLRRRDVPLAARQRRPRGDPDAPPEPRSRATGCPTPPTCSATSTPRWCYNVWQYWQVTTDLEFMRFWGAEMVLEIARFWASAADLQPCPRPLRDQGRDGPRRVPRGATPTATSRGSTTTPTPTSWRCGACCRAFDVLEILPGTRRARADREAADSATRSWTAGATSAARCGCASTTTASSASSRATTTSRSSTGTRYREQVRQHRPARPDPRGRGRLAEPLQARQAGRHADAVLPAVHRGAGASCSGRPGLRPRRRTSSDRNVALLRAAHRPTARPSVGMVHAWLHSRLDRAKSWEPVPLGARVRHQRRAGRHDPRGHPPGRHGRHRRPGPALLRRHRDPRGHALPQSRACPRSCTSSASRSSTAASRSSSRSPTSHMRVRLAEDTGQVAPGGARGPRGVHRARAR